VHREVHKTLHKANNDPSLFMHNNRKSTLKKKKTTFIHKTTSIDSKLIYNRHRKNKTTKNIRINMERSTKTKEFYKMICLPDEGQERG
jgi:hypothetical protein